VVDETASCSRRGHISGPVASAPDVRAVNLRMKVHGRAAELAERSAPNFLKSKLLPAPTPPAATASKQSYKQEQ
jgi:hypothetical protein